MYLTQSGDGVGHAAEIAGAIVNDGDHPKLL
jgi:hypothetical protein